MAEIVDIAEYRKQKLAKAVVAWEECMARAEQFQKEGKDQFAAKMLEKAKEARKIIDKLRPPVVKKSNKPARFLKPDGTNPTFTFSADMGYPKPDPETA